MENKIENHAEKCKQKAYINRTDLETIPACDCDGYHTFNELYDHRIALFIALCKFVQSEDESAISYGGVTRPDRIWRSELHSDGIGYGGWFILGINKEKGEQITYHLPISRWEETNFAETLEKAPEFDGHTSDDVLLRLKNI